MHLKDERVEGEWGKMFFSVVYRDLYFCCRICDYRDINHNSALEHILKHPYQQQRDAYIELRERELDSRIDILREMSQLTQVDRAKNLMTTTKEKREVKRNIGREKADTLVVSDEGN